MLQDGIVARYLADHCPDPRLRLCAHRARTADRRRRVLLERRGSVFNRLGRFAGLGDEMAHDRARKACATIRRWQAEDGAAGDGAPARAGRDRRRRGEHDLAHLRDHREIHAVGGARHARRAPAARRTRFRRHQPHSRAGRAGRRCCCCLRSWCSGCRRASRSPISAALAATVALALLANAFVCGVLANPHDRYGARLVWMAPLVVLLAVWQLCMRRHDAAGPTRAARRPSPDIAPRGGIRGGPGGPMTAGPVGCGIALSFSYFRRMRGAR